MKHLLRPLLGALTTLSLAGALAAAEAGVHYCFIEDESPSATSRIPQSLRFLETIKF